MTNNSSTSGATTDAATPTTPDRSDHRLSSRSVDVVFEILANTRRRHALSMLAEADHAVSIDELVEQLASWEADGDELSEVERQQLAASLHHTHLPKLADFGFIEYDDRTRTARWRRQPEFMRACLEQALEWERL